MRLKPIIIAVAVLAVVALIVRQVSQAVKHTFSPPANLAQLAHGSLPTQNALTLMEIDNVSPDRSYNYTDKGPQDNGGSTPFTAADTGLWIKLPPGFSLPPNCSQSNYNNCDKVLSVTARFYGETFSLGWQSSTNSNGNGNQTYLLASIPAGYPDTIRWMDVTVDTLHGDKATWRITHLLPMQHVITPPVKAQATFQQGSIHVIAHAICGKPPYNPAPKPTILYDLNGMIQGATHQWELGHLTQTLEWEPPGFVPKDSGSTMGSGKVGNKVTVEMRGQSLYYNQSYPYLPDMHWVRLGATLQEFETYDETVVFHNLSVFKQKNGGMYLVGSGAQTVTTPSGVPVTLDDVQHPSNMTNSFGGNGYAVHLLYPQTTLFASLPHSPFWRKYKRLIKISADIPKPYSSMGSSYGNNEGTYMFRVDGYGLNNTGPLPKVIASFPVTIHQRVDLRSVPMTFTLPVEKK